jgi:hypothetical protein
LRFEVKRPDARITGFKGQMQRKEQDMAARRIIISLAAAISGLIVFQSAVSAQDQRGTEEQRMACTPDVFRLCGAEIPDTNRIVSCLRHNTALLSRPCRAVFETANSPQGAPQQAAPRGRAVQPPPYGAQPYQYDQPYRYDDNDDE